MLWNRPNLTPEVSIPKQSVSPERSPEDRQAGQCRHEAFNLIDVIFRKDGRWKATCECGEAPGYFAEERAAWRWIADHRCPVLDADGRSA